MQTHALLPRLTGIRLHPIKSLDPVAVPEARIGPGGGLEHDRAWALFSVDGRWVNGKRTAAMHLIRATYATDLSSVTLAVPGDRRNLPARTFPFPGGAEEAAEWFSVYFEQQILVRHAPEGFPDDTIANGPTIISTASLQMVSDWFPGLTLDSARQRFRTTLEIDSAHGAANAASETDTCPRSGKINSTAKTSAAWSVSASAKSILRAAIPAPAAPFPDAIRKRAPTSPAFKNVSAICAAKLCRPGRQPPASTIFIA